MILKLSEIWLAPDRLREKENYGDIEEFAAELESLGQLQSILIQPTPPEELNLSEGRPWKIVDGGRRFTAVSHLEANGRAVRHRSIGEIRVEIEEEPLDDFGSLLREFYANESRVNFTWKERGEFVRRVHDMQMARAEGAWSVELTGTILKMSKESVYKYLQMTSDPEVFNSVDVQGSDTFTTAYKKSTILKARKKRERAVPLTATVSDEPEPSEELTPEEHDTRLDMTARTLYSRADARDWIKRNSDGLFDFIHWDPPYGGDQDGGAHASHERIDDTKENAFALHRDLLPELHRTLKDGHWMVFWFYPPFAEQIRHLLQGHLIEPLLEETGCTYCGKPLDQIDRFKRCPKAPWGFWVNAHPNLWFKQNRNADGHEIKRFLTNQTEMFYLAGKWEEKEPILTNSSRGNVFAFDMIPKAIRRHIMHKPPGLLAEILRLISLPGELGCDPSAGSGSIIEAGLAIDRRLITCELSEEVWLDGIGAVKDALKAKGVGSMGDWKKLGRSG